MIRRYKKAQHVFVSKNQMNSAALKINSKVIHNGIALEDFKFQKKPSDYFVYLGYITQNKGAHIAAQAARWANENLPIRWRGPSIAAVIVVSIVAMPFWYTQLNRLVSVSAPLLD